MNKQTIKKLLSYAQDELPLATLGVIEGMLEEYRDGNYVEAFDCLEEITFAVESFKELRKQDEKEMSEPCLSE